MNLKILVATHKPCRLPKGDVFLPIQVGAANHLHLPGMQRDDTGDSISFKNPHYCELTALYWGWKNLDVDYLGLCHYRRYFAVRTLRGSKWNRIADRETLERAIGSGIILPKKRRYFIETNYSQYAHAHHACDLDMTRCILAERWPTYLPAFDRVMRRTSGHRFNMFVMRRDILDVYCSWLFDVLFELEARLDIRDYNTNDARVFGFVSERLLDVWLETIGATYTELPVVFTEKQNWINKGGAFLKRKFMGQNQKKAMNASIRLPHKSTKLEKFGVKRLLDSDAQGFVRKPDILVSVLIPIYNSEAYIDRCLRSIQQQSYSCLEILVVDDGSVDKSLQICEKFAAADTRIRILSQKNRGVSAARNTAVENARGNYIAFVDSDDWVEPTYIEKMLSACLANHTSMSACNHWIHTSTRCIPRFRGVPSGVLTARTACENILYDAPPDVSPWGKLYDEKLLRKIWYPVGKCYEDTFCIAELVLNAGRIAYVDEPLYWYSIQPDSISRGSFRVDKLDFMEAVSHMTDVMCQSFPDMRQGAVRRKVHAALSVRRYLVDCSPEDELLRNRLEALIRKAGGDVLLDPRAPMRDKIGIGAVMLGHWGYDFFWKTYKRWVRPD